MNVSLRNLFPTLWRWAVGLTGVGLLLSLYSSYEYVHIRFFPFAGQAACNISAALNCEQAIQSPYAEFFGRSLGSWGALYYSAALLFLLFYSPEEEEKPKGGLALYLIFSFFSVALSLFLFWLSLQTLTALCPVCLGLYLVSFGLFTVAILMRSGSSIWERLLLGLILLVRFPLFASQFVFQLIGDYLLSVRGILLVLCLGLFGVSSVSDSLMFWYLSSHENVEERTYGMFSEWESEPLRQIPFQGDDDAFGDYRKGGANASVRIVEFFDYECPACRQFYVVMKELQQEFGEQISVEYRNYPLDKSCNKHMEFELHHHACEAAEFARCAGEQGKFFEASEYLFTLEAFDDRKAKRHVSEAIRSGIGILQLDETAMDECLSSNRQITPLERDVEIAQELKLRQTPSVWVNGRQVKNLRLLRDLVVYLLKSTEE